VSVTVKNGTTRRGLAARATTALRRLGFRATNGGNAAPAAVTGISHAPATGAAATTLARAVKAGGRVARSPRPGLARTSVVLVLGDDFRGVTTRVATPARRAPRPPKPTPATRTLPPWDPRPC
jgi:hypothetical protein